MAYNKQLPWCKKDDKTCHAVHWLRYHGGKCQLTCEFLETKDNCDCETCIHNVLISDAKRKAIGLKRKHAECEVHEDFVGPCEAYIPSGTYLSISRHE